MNHCVDGREYEQRRAGSLPDMSSWTEHQTEVASCLRKYQTEGGQGELGECVGSLSDMPSYTEYCTRVASCVMYHTAGREE